MVIYDNPWPHIVIDDYYETHIFEEILNEGKKFLAKNVDKATRKQEFQNPDNSILKECINSRLLDESYFDVLTDHRPYSCLNPYWELNFLRGPFSYPIHDESPRKVLSCVVYVGPEQNAGTSLYDKDKNFVKEVVWKPNRALVFAAQDGVTWHDYTCPRGSLRITINQFLERPRDE